MGGGLRNLTSGADTVEVSASYLAMYACIYKNKLVDTNDAGLLHLCSKLLAYKTSLW